MQNAYDPHRLLQAVLRTNFAAFAMKVAQTLIPSGDDPFQPNWHHDALAYHFDQVRTGKIKRLVVNLPPRTAKSIYLVALCAFIHGHDPTKKIGCLSYAGELAGKLARDYRTVITSDWYRALFPGTRISPEKNTEAEIVLTAGGYRLGWTLTGTITGRGADFIFIDDPIKAEDAFSEVIRSKVTEIIDGTVLSRFDNKGAGAVITVMQRFHPEDYSGHMLAKGGCTHLSLPAIAISDEHVPVGPGQTHFRRAGDLLHPERETQEDYDRLRLEMGAMRFSAQVQQAPVPVEGNLIKWAWFEPYDVAPDPSEGVIIQSWDTAEKIGAANAYSVCLTFLRIGRRHYLLHVLREKLLYPDLKRTVVAHAQAWRAGIVLIEQASLGTALFYDLREEPGAPDIIPIYPDGDKAIRMATCSTTIEARMVFIPTTAEWLDAFKVELLQFPHGAYADQIDALSQYLNWAKTNFPTDDLDNDPRYAPVQLFGGDRSPPYY